MLVKILAEHTSLSDKSSDLSAGDTEFEYGHGCWHPDYCGFPLTL
jgi:hypothetical protein